MSPLSEPVTARAVGAFRREMKAKHPLPKEQQRQSLGAGIAVGAILLVALLVAPGFVSLLMGGAPPIVGDAIRLALGAFIVIAAAIILYNVLRARAVNRARFRISRFAASNGMSYVGRMDAPRLPGMIFQVGKYRHSSDLVRSRSPRFVEYGNYEYLSGNGAESNRHRWGYVAVKLDSPLPNIVLDALGNNSLGSRLPAALSGEQRLSLEGDFDRYFTLYCPRGYEADALYLFTPDIMARFIDHAAQIDVEIVDSWMFLYLKRPVSTTDPATWSWLFSTVDALTAKVDQWARWRDDRLTAGAAAGAGADAGASASAPPASAVPAPPRGVALAGRRLKQGVSWAAVAGIVLLVAIFVVQNVLPGLLG